jgi:hypothetical protein
MDLPPYRARRILCSWIAFAMGLGRPAWILQAYSIENVLAWLIFAWVLTRWMPPTTPRGFALWAGTLLSHGMLASVRYALVDAPSTLILAVGVIAAEEGRPWIASAILGAAGLARETSLLAASMFARLLSRKPRTWILVGGLAVLCAVPLIVWLDYLRSIYRSTAFEGGGNVTTPLMGLVFELKMLRHAVSDPSLRPVWPDRWRIRRVSHSGRYRHRVAREREPRRGRSSRRRSPHSHSSCIRSSGGWRVHTRAAAAVPSAPTRCSREMRAVGRHCPRN